MLMLNNMLRQVFEGMKEKSDSLQKLYTEFMNGVYGQAIDPETFIQGSVRLSPQQQFAAYRGSVVGNLSNVLADIFPSVNRCLGENFFDAMGRRYIDEHPSTSPSLDNYGQAFPAFCDTFTPLKEYPYIGDLARIDWAWHQAFHALDEQVLSLIAIQGLEPEHYLALSLQLSESLHIVDSSFPIFRIWQFTSGSQAHSEQALSSLNFEEGAESVLVWRIGYDIGVAHISEIEQRFLRLVENGETLGTIFATLLSEYSQTQVMSCFAGLCEKQCFVA